MTQAAQLRHGVRRHLGLLVGAEGDAHATNASAQVSWSPPIATTSMHLAQRGDDGGERGGHLGSRMHLAQRGDETRSMPA